MTMRNVQPIAGSQIVGENSEKEGIIGIAGESVSVCCGFLLYTINFYLFVLI